MNALDLRRQFPALAAALASNRADLDALQQTLAVADPILSMDVVCLALRMAQAQCQRRSEAAAHTCPGCGDNADAGYTLGDGAAACRACGWQVDTLKILVHDLAAIARGLMRPPARPASAAVARCVGNYGNGGECHNFADARGCPGCGATVCEACADGWAWDEVDGAVVSCCDAAELAAGRYGTIRCAAVTR